MEFEELQKKWRIELNWRAHVYEHVGLQKYLKRNGKGINPEKYAVKEGIDPSAFRWWLAFIELEDKFTFYRSFATEYLNRAMRSLELLGHYIDIDPKLRMRLQSFEICIGSTCTATVESVVTCMKLRTGDI